MWIYKVNHSLGFALDNLPSRIDGGMHDRVVNGSIDPGDTNLRANLRQFYQRTLSPTDLIPCPSFDT